MAEADAPGNLCARAGVTNALGLLQEWLADERLISGQLALVTRGAVATNIAEPPVDLGGAAVAGLVRSAQSEQPGRFAMIDWDGQESSWRALPAALGSGEPIVAIRDGEVLVPRLERAGDLEPIESAGRLDPARTVLITGGTGALGGILARHLVNTYGAKRLLLVSRRGPTAEGAGELEAELTELGAEVTVASSDVSDRAALETLLRSIPDEHPLGAVVHAAGVIEDGLIESLTPERIDAVVRTKGGRSLASARSDQGEGTLYVPTFLVGGRDDWQPWSRELRGSKRIS